MNWQRDMGENDLWQHTPRLKEHTYPDAEHQAAQPFTYSELMLYCLGLRKSRMCPGDRKAAIRCDE